MLVYHRTHNAAAILDGGFRDAEGTYMTPNTYRGVWVSAPWPLDDNEGAHGPSVLEVDVPDALFEEYEWVEEGKTYREALVPAVRLNKCAVRELSDEEVDLLTVARWDSFRH